MVDVEELAEQINKNISSRTKLGYREVTTKKRGYRLIWSNNAERWFLAHSPEPAGTYKLDANVIMVEGKKSDIEAALPYLRGLPLYGQSFEANYIRESKEDMEDRKKKRAKAKSKRKVVKKCKCK
jgi:hypothetical protein